MKWPNWLSNEDEAAGWILVVLGGIILVASIIIGLPIVGFVLIYGGAWALDLRGTSMSWWEIVGPVLAFVSGLAIGSAAIYVGNKWRHPDMGNVVIGWVSFWLGIVAMLLLILVLALLVGSICLGIMDTGYEYSVPWGHIAGPLVVIILGLVVSGLAVWGGWRLTHPRKQAHLEKPQPPDESADVSGGEGV
jgi:hypothetical protein